MEDFENIGDLNLDGLLDYNFSDLFLSDYGLDFPLDFNCPFLDEKNSDVLVPNQEEQNEVVNEPNVLKAQVNVKPKISKRLPYTKKKTKPRPPALKSKQKERTFTLNKNSIFQGKHEEIIRITKIEEEYDVDVENDFVPIAPAEFKVRESIIVNRPNFNLKWKLDKLPETKYTLAHKARLNHIRSLPNPLNDTVVDPNFVSQEERTIFHEFFRNYGRSDAKKYLEIRNHIIDKWTSSHKQLNKRAARAGLNKCDVNMVSLIFEYLEQKGIINFAYNQSHYSKRKDGVGKS